MYKETSTNGKCHSSVIDKIAGLLLIIGGLNWGLFGLFDYDLVAALFGHLTTLSKVVYILVGLSAVYWLIKCIARKKECA